MVQGLARLSDPFADCPHGCFGTVLEGSTCRFCAMLDRSSRLFEWTLISLRLTNAERHGER